MRTLDFSDGFESASEPTGAGVTAADVTVTPSGNLASTDAQAALVELQLDIDTRATASSVSDHLADTTDAHDASAISSVASGNLSATNVQTALDELQSDIDTRALDADLDSHTGNTSNPHSVTHTQVGSATAQWNANKLQGVAINAGAPSTNNVLTYNGTDWAPASPGASTLAVVSKTTTYTATTADDVILCSTSGGTWTLTLFTAVGNTGKRLYIKKTTSDFTVLTIDGNASETIDGSTTTTLNTQYESLTIISDGTNWQILERKIPTEKIAWTPTGSWTNCTYSGFGHRIGDCLYLQGKLLVNSTPAVAALSVNILSGIFAGLTIDTAKKPTGNIPIGSWQALDTGVEDYSGLTMLSGNTINFMDKDGQSQCNITTPWAVGTNDYYAFFAGPIPISGWKA